MVTVMPSSELVKRAFAHICEVRLDMPGRSLQDLVDEAAMRFNLSPLDAAALLRLFTQEEDAS